MKIEYDPLGRRITKTVGETVYHYTWSGDQLIEIRDGDGNLLKFIIYGNNLDEPIVMMGSATTYYFTTDGLGSISEITDEYGGLEEYYTYDAYGAPSLFDGTGTPISTSAANNPFYFTGREYDFETGIYYYRARYYDPVLGRFLETDPLGYIDSPNLYAYVGNNPLNWLDPWGLDKQETVGSIADALDTINELAKSKTDTNNIVDLVSIITTVANNTPKGTEVNVIIIYQDGRIVDYLVGDSIIFDPDSMETARYKVQGSKESPSTNVTSGTPIPNQMRETTRTPTLSAIWQRSKEIIELIRRINRERKDVIKRRKN